MFSPKNNGFSADLLKAVREATAKGPMPRNPKEVEEAKQIAEVKMESKKDFEERQKNLVAGSAQRASDPERLKRMMQIPGYSEAIALAHKTVAKLNKEEFEQIDEISAKLKAAYTKKSKRDEALYRTMSRMKTQQVSDKAAGIKNTTYSAPHIKLQDKEHLAMFKARKATYDWKANKRKEGQRRAAEEFDLSVEEKTDWLAVAREKIGGEKDAMKKKRATARNAMARNAMGSIPKTPQQKALAAKSGHPGRITQGDVVKARMGEELELDEAKKLIHAFTHGDHTAKVYRDAEYNEYQVHHFKNGKHMGEGPVSFHDHKDDAMGTAAAEAKKWGKINEEEVQQVSEDMEENLRIAREKAAARKARIARRLGKPADDEKPKPESSKRTVTGSYGKSYHPSEDRPTQESVQVDSLFSEDELLAIDAAAAKFKQ